MGIRLKFSAAGGARARGISGNTSQDFWDQVIILLAEKIVFSLQTTKEILRVSIIIFQPLNLKTIKVHQFAPKKDLIIEIMLHMF